MVDEITASEMAPKVRRGRSSGRCGICTRRDLAVRAHVAQVAKARNRIVEECREIDATNPPFSLCLMARTKVANFKDFHLFCTSDHMRMDLNDAVEVACDFINREKNKSKIEEMFAKCGGRGAAASWERPCAGSCTPRAVRGRRPRRRTRAASTGATASAPRCSRSR